AGVLRGAARPERLAAAGVPVLRRDVGRRWHPGADRAAARAGRRRPVERHAAGATQALMDAGWPYPRSTSRAVGAPAIRVSTTVACPVPDSLSSRRSTAGSIGEPRFFTVTAPTP